MFDLKKAKINLAIKWERFFRVVSFFKGIFFIITGCGFFAFLIFQSRKSIGFSIIFLVFALIFKILESFFSFLKKPTLKIKIEKVLQQPEEFNLADFLSFEVAKSIAKSQKFSTSHKLKINSTMLLYFLLKENPEMEFIFQRALLDFAKVKEKLKEKITTPSQKNFQEIILESLKIAKERNHNVVERGDFFILLSKIDSVFEKILIENRLLIQDIENLVWWQEILQEREEKEKRFWEMENLTKRGSIGRNFAAGYTITLDKFSVDWTEIIKKRGFEEIVGHQKEIEKIERVLAKETINNVLLVGEPGSGRKSIVHALTKKILFGQSLPAINYKRIVELDLPALLSLAETEEGAEFLLDRVFQEAVFAGNVILVIDEFPNFVRGARRPGVIDISEVLLKYLKFPQLRVIGICSFSGFHRYVEQNPSILALFEKVNVSEISERETILVLENKVPLWETKYKKFISYLALRDVVKHCTKYLPTLPFPKKAIDLLEEVLVYVSRYTKSKIVLPEHVAKIVTEKTKIPVGEIERKEREVLLNLEQLIHKRIINQDEAVNEISEAMRRARAEITIRKGPIGTFLFLGPTGVGKCITPDTILFTSQGVLSVEKFIPKNLGEDRTLPLKLELYTKDGPKFTSQIYNGGVKPTLRIKTALGYEIEGTLVHPILTINQSGNLVFKRLQELKRGDYVVIQRNQQYFGKDTKIKFNFEKSPHDTRSRSIKIPKTLTKELARLLGYLVGEGCTIYRKTTKFSNKEKFIIEDVKNILKKTFGLKLIHYETDRAQDFWIHSVWFRQFLEKIGINYGKSDSKEIPEVILRAPKEFVAEYLKGYFEAEGSPVPSNHRVEISTASKKMAKQLHVLLLNFGIVSKLRERFNKKLKKFYYRIEIFGENIDIFSKEIGFLSQRKKSRLKLLLNKKRNPNIDVIPFLKNRLVQLKERYFEEGYHYCSGAAHKYCLENWYRKNISYNTLKLVLKEHKVIETAPQFRILKNILEQHYLYLPIVEIVPGESQVYDFVVPETHSFFGNGFINHNTETSKALAEIYFGSEERMIRLDMSEFQDTKDIPRLIGAPEKEGLLTTAIREKPFSLILLDEIEKAHPDILNLFLQVMDEGYITDGIGRKVDFKNSIIIATSNAGYKVILSALKERTEWPKVKAKLLDYLFEQAIFRPEFINRFDAVVVFKPLTKENLLDIAHLMLSKLRENLAKKHIEFEITQPLKEKIVELGYSPVFGAREMRRVIQDKVENPIANALLSGKLKRGDRIKITENFEIEKI